jgi:protein-S-isoprenylcysteine O-methyltransferase Ste14
MPPLIDRDSLAGEVVVAAVLFPIAAELAATYAGRREAELRKGLGEAYTGYARTTARLVPHVW